MKKIPLMLITHDLAIGGLQQVVVNICRTIDRDMFDVSVLCLRRRGELASEIESIGIDVTCIPQKKNGTDYLSFLKVARVLRDQNIEVIHTHNTQPFIDGTIAALLSGVKTIVHTDHARDFPDKQRYMLAEWLMSHFAYKIVGVSDHTSDNLRKFEKISPKKILTIPNGIDESKYSIILNRDKKRKELGITSEGPIIGLGVRLTEQKGITYLLQAMPEIIQCFPDITLIIAGEGHLGPSLNKESKSLGIERNVLFVGPRLDMPHLLKLFDLYVLPSLWEGLPMVLLEAMAAGCPIVATDVGGNFHAIQHRVNGSLISPRSPALLASEIITLLKNDDMREQYIQKSLEVFKAKFSAKIMTTQYERLYRREL